MFSFRKSLIAAVTLGVLALPLMPVGAADDKKGPRFPPAPRAVQGLIIVGLLSQKPVGRPTKLPLSALLALVHALQLPKPGVWLAFRMVTSSDPATSRGRSM